MPKLKDREPPASLIGFGSRLRAARKASGLTLEALASEIGSNTAVISRAENDVRLPTLAEAVRLAEALDTRIGWLLSGEPPARGQAVAVLVEDDGDTAQHLRRQVVAELASRNTGKRALRRQARHGSD